MQESRYEAHQHESNFAFPGKNSMHYICDVFDAYIYYMAIYVIYIYDIMDICYVMHDKYYSYYVLYNIGYVTCDI